MNGARLQRGRKPKPVAVLKLEGTYDSSRHRRRQHEPATEGELADVDPPRWLTADQKRIWRQAVKDAPKGVLRRGDRHLFVSFVVAAARFETAARKQNEMDSASTAPFLMRGASGKAMLSPYLRVMREASAVLVQLGAELGFSPSARARLGQPGEPALSASTDDDNTWAELRRFPVITGGKSKRGAP
jgi:P27 family predicted phage terminase small subunit